MQWNTHENYNLIKIPLKINFKIKYKKGAWLISKRNKIKGISFWIKLQYFLLRSTIESW